MKHSKSTNLQSQVTSNQSQVTNHQSPIRIGITGQAGFMGTHLFNYLKLKEGVELIPFKDEFFNSQEILENFVKQCDVIVHLAAMNRHDDQNVIYNTNIKLVKDLISACENTNSTPHILMSSSTQENRDNLYGKSKKEGRELLEKWANENGAYFTGMLIPNVFGPFGQPYYNSVIATFCHQLTHGELPQIQVDGELKLIYINELVEEFWKKIHQTNHYLQITNHESQITIHKSLITNHKSLITNYHSTVERYEVPHTSVNKVSEILELLKIFKEQYFDNGIIPEINNGFELALFNTFRCYFPIEKFPFFLKQNIDNRGSFVEIIRTNVSGQYSYSTTKPGITRGDHYHTRKIERFAVISGKAKIELRRIGTDEIVSYDLNGENPSFVDMPIWTTHNITNIGDTDLYTLFWINEPYDPNDPDTYFEKVRIQ
ncbi:MAG: NAD-dependent epimerase/dehydratase family protein [Ignavibacteriae bacterium]|nr:NAD-dependent epimerase/dehydratase family protein [Ignavibacteriota bacterium]